MLSLETISRSSGPRSELFRYIRLDSSLVVAEYPPSVGWEDITRHRDLIDDDLLAEIIAQRLVEPDRFDAGTISTQPFNNGGCILVYCHSEDLMLPVTEGARYATSRLLQQKLGGPREVRPMVEKLYERQEFKSLRLA